MGLALELRLLVPLVLIGLAAYFLWNAWQAVQRNPRTRQRLALLLPGLLRRGLLPLLIVLLRVLRLLR